MIRRSETFLKLLILLTHIFEQEVLIILFQRLILPVIDMINKFPTLNFVVFLQLFNARYLHIT